MTTNAPQGTSLSSDSGPRKVWFTGYANDETTKLTTTALPYGAVLCFTEGGGFKGRGTDATKPETAILSLFAGIVTSFDSPLVGQIAVAGDGSGVTAGKLIPGWVTIVSASPAVSALCKVNVTKPSTALLYLGPSNGSFYLDAAATSVGSAALNSAGLSQAVAIPLQTDASLTATPALTVVRLGGIFGGLES